MKKGISTGIVLLLAMAVFLPGRILAEEASVIEEDGGFSTDERMSSARALAIAQDFVSGKTGLLENYGVKRMLPDTAIDVGDYWHVVYLVKEWMPVSGERIERVAVVVDKDTGEAGFYGSREKVEEAGPGQDAIL
ncbi:MAG: hypothetical protein PHH49_08180 [Candidatus Omnitrophica bacterium]|nr:hypothetical protein [Candidatus Omnitrophota bacterium]MDD5488916.1 hypothetical protein [Candidatus Omnitrophota bacterium]